MLLVTTFFHSFSGTAFVRLCVLWPVNNVLCCGVVGIFYDETVSIYMEELKMLVLIEV